MPVKEGGTHVRRTRLAALATLGIVASGSLATSHPATATHIQRRAVYLIDYSSAAAGHAETCGDVNGDGSTNLLDCEITAAMVGNEDAASYGAVRTGVIGFASEGLIADVSPLTGQQSLTTTGRDANENRTEDLDEVFTSLTGTGFTEFTSKTATASSPELDAALAALTSFADNLPAESGLQAALLSSSTDSVDTGPGSALQNIADRGITVDTFAFGTENGCGPGSSLAEIAGTTGGICTEMTDSSQLHWFAAPKPDALIKRSTDAAYVGNNVYNHTGNSQKRGWQLEAGKTRTFNLRFQNDGSVREPFLVRGPRSSRKFRLTYLYNSADVTDHVISGTFFTRELRPAQQVGLRLKIKATRRATDGDFFAARVTAISVSDGSTKDAVKAKVTIR